MRVALCLSGFATKMYETHPYLQKYILNELNPDIFYYGYHDKHTSESEILDMYKPVSYHIRKFDDNASKQIINEYTGSHPRANTGELAQHKTRHSSEMPLLSQFYNVFKSNELKSQKEQSENFTYDVVIRARNDCFFCRRIEEFELDMIEDYVCVPDFWDWLHGYSDSFAFGNSANMDTYSDLFYKFAPYHLEDGCVLHPETMLKHHFNKQGLKREIVRTHYWWNMDSFISDPDNGDHNARPPTKFPWRSHEDAII